MMGMVMMRLRSKGGALSNFVFGSSNERTYEDLDVGTLRMGGKQFTLTLLLTRTGRISRRGRNRTSITKRKTSVSVIMLKLRILFFDCQDTENRLEDSVSEPLC